LWSDAKAETKSIGLHKTANLLRSEKVN